MNFWILCSLLSCSVKRAKIFSSPVSLSSSFRSILDLSIIDTVFWSYSFSSASSISGPRLDLIESCAVSKEEKMSPGLLWAFDPSKDEKYDESVKSYPLIGPWIATSSKNSNCAGTIRLILMTVRVYRIICASARNLSLYFIYFFLLSSDTQLI